MPRVIDGDNLLGTWPGRSRSNADKEALVRQLDLLARGEKQLVVVVFDGNPPAGFSPGPDVVFSGPGRTADAVILEVLRASGGAGGWIVVTNDRSLADRCRFAGASVEGVRAFRARLDASR